MLGTRSLQLATARLSHVTRILWPERILPFASSLTWVCSLDRSTWRREIHSSRLSLAETESAFDKALNELRFSRSPRLQTPIIGTPVSEMLENRDLLSLLPESSLGSPAAHAFSSVEERISILKHFTKTYKVAIPSNVFPMLRTVGDTAQLFERLLKPAQSEMWPVLKHGIPENLKLDRRTFDTNEKTEAHIKYKLHRRTRRGSFKFKDKLRQRYVDAWNASPRYRRGEGPTDPQGVGGPLGDNQESEPQP